ncbi:MAG: hypothetical protein ABR903_00330 [Thermodesulfovibrionales bacterium]|jgi:V/A-type H+-transporting ATPase subunit E
MAQKEQIESSEAASKLASEGATQTAVVESGVESLIGRLRDQGIEQGRSQAEALVAAAQKQAADIVAEANRKAEAILATGGQEAKKLKASGEDSLRLAMRDTILSMEGDLIKEFTSKLRRMVQGVLSEPDFLRSLILEIARRVAPEPSAGRLEMLLPAEFITLDDLRRKPEEAKPGTLMHFVVTMGGDMLREGMSFSVAADDAEAGIRIRLVDEDVQIDMTEGAVSRLLLRHMLPRFRALLRGMVAESGSERQTAPAKTPSIMTTL